MLTKPDTETTITSEILNHQDKSTVAVSMKWYSNWSTETTGNTTQTTQDTKFD